MSLKLKILIALSSFAALGIIAVFGINAYVKCVGGKRIVNESKVESLEDVDCILVLGCYVRGDRPSDMLSHRLDYGISLYKSGVAPKLLVSGDHGTVGYDEVNAMKQYAVDAGIPSTDVFMDHAGFSTYESIYRAKAVFGVDKVVIVTQRYHLYRALYIAEKLGLDAYGIASDVSTYYGQTARDLREILARVKDFGSVIFKPKPTYLGEAIPISGDGNQTNDK